MTIIEKLFLKNTKGFLIVESLLSIAILSIGLTLVLRSFSKSLYAAKLSKDYLEVLSLIDYKILEIEDPALTISSDIKANEKFSWDITSTETPLLSREEPEEEAKEKTTEEETTEEAKKKIYLKEVNLEASWKGRNRKENISIATFMTEVVTEVPNEP